MPAFRYEAVEEAGTTKKGVVNADSAHAARAELRTQGLVPITVDAIATQFDETGQTKRSAFGDRLSTGEQAMFTRQLASLLEASLPLEQAFSALLEQAERTYVRDLIASIRSEVMGGASLSDALAKHPRDFADIYRALVASGEQIGQLARVLSRLADYIERRNALVQKATAFTIRQSSWWRSDRDIFTDLCGAANRVGIANTKRNCHPTVVMGVRISCGTTAEWYCSRHQAGLAASRAEKSCDQRAGIRLLTAPLYGKSNAASMSRFASTLLTTVPACRFARVANQPRYLTNVAMRAQVEAATASARGCQPCAPCPHKHFPAMLIHDPRRRSDR